MASYQFEDKLRRHAEQFIGALKRGGVDGSVVEDSFREFSVKVVIFDSGKDFGAAVLFYSPKSDSFSMKTHELKDKSITPVLEDSWKKGERQVEQAERAERGYDIYVDGSFTGGATGYGVAILNEGNLVDELYGGVDEPEADGTYQVAGELTAVKEALNWCLEHSVTEVSIYYDYFGIEKWATRQWKANQPVTQEYSRFVRECPVKVHWHKVDAHTGNRWNDRADALAKKGARSIQPAAVQQDLLGELVEKAEAWIEFLMVKGIEASFDRVYNEQFARIYIIREDNPAGTFDLYNTKKKRLTTYLHGFRDEALRLRIESLWKERFTPERVS